MANITVDKHTNDNRKLAARATWDPFTAFRELLQWDPFRQGASLEGVASFAPAFEIKETKDAFEFKADVPGVDAKDLEVHMNDNRLTVSGKREAEKTDKSDTYYSYERSYGSFTRSFALPEGVDADSVRADLKDGVLKLVLAKKPESKPREVKVRTA